jgi:RNA polymerase sigma factor (TIGR02999 family)
MLLAFFARGRPAYPCLKIGPVSSPSFWSTGSTATRRRLSPWFQIVYKERRRLAHYHLQSERPDHTLQSTALVHEAYLRLSGNDPAQLQNRAHLPWLAAHASDPGELSPYPSREQTRRGMQEHSRGRGGPAGPGRYRLLALDDAMNELSRIDERHGKIVEMKFFGGLSAPEISSVLGISRATVDRDWANACVWLHRQIMRRTT